VKLAYDDAGSGECVVLIHGHPFDRTLWLPQLGVLSREFRVVAPDLRGFGHSPVTQHLVTMRELATDIQELLGILGIGRAAVVGLSMGSLVTMELAASQPERYWAIGLVATTMEAPTPAEREVRRGRADAVERDGMQVLLDYMHAGVYGPKCPESVRERVDAMMSAAPPAGAAAALRGRAERPDYRPLLTRLDIPALVCAGSADPWSDREVTAEIIAHLKRPEPVMIDSVGHLPNLTLSVIYLQTLGVGLATAVLIDANVVRGILLPAALSMLGDRAWRRLDSRRTATPIQPATPMQPATEVQSVGVPSRGSL
jgi:3-oxoadipate enol-lactonase